MLSLPETVVARNWRAFRDETTLGIRPVTLLFGVNNSGKSALARLLPLFQESLKARAPGPLNLEGPSHSGATYRDLICRKPAGVRDVTLGLRWRDGATMAWDIYVPDRLPVVRRFRWNDDVWSHEPQRDDTPRTEWLTYRGGEARVQVRCRGLWSEVRPATPPVFEGLEPRLRAFAEGVTWLGPSRNPGGLVGSRRRLHPLPAGPPTRVAADGTNVAAILHTDPATRDHVSAWYESNLGRTLDVREIPGAGLRLSLSLGAEDVDLDDSGEGMAQVLPVLTAVGLAATRSTAHVTVIEEPESHLHPRLQLALMEHIVAAVRHAAPAGLVIETHSSHLLLGIQREILRGRLRPEDVAVYWVEQDEAGTSRAHLVPINDQARFGAAWPPGVFRSDTELAREIVELRRAST